MPFIEASNFSKNTKIVCTVPSLSELLVDLGLEKQLIGITKFCVHPRRLKQEKSIIGGTKNLNIQKIVDLEPDVIIANKEENCKPEIEQLAEHFPVWLTDIASINDNLELITRFGTAFNIEKEALRLRQEIERSLKNCKTHFSDSCHYLIWKRPYMTVGRDTYISDVLRHVGLTNACQEKRYPEISIQNLKESNTPLIFLSSEPYPFKEKDKQEMQTETNKKVIKVDGEIFSWYGSRIKYIANHIFAIKACLS